MSKITHEHMKVIIDFNSEYYEEIIDYITQQEKREKLLELYKELSNIYEKLYTIDLSDLILNRNYYRIEIKKLKQQIKELENETY